ncbi:MAG: SDR family NAD(P)-dependent oxidoreductase, partial [Microbacterium sp.]
MTRDQYTFTNPAELYADFEPKKQHQPEPGLDAELDPKADLGEKTYRGMGRLKGRKALITGADSGIGAATAIAFAREGADVAMSYLPEEEVDAQRIAQILQDAGANVLTLPGDLRDPDYCRDLVEQAVNGLGGLDILVNNGGKQVYNEDLATLDDEQFDDTFKTNVYAMFWITKAALAHLTPGSAIINTTSVQAYK